MQSYTVGKGDTLSGIAKRVGLGSNFQSLGYSGDPRKLKVGTVLNFGGGAPTPSNPTAPAQPSLPFGGQTQGEYGSASRFMDDFGSGQQALLDRIKSEQNTLNSEYETRLGGQEKLSNAFKRLSNETGLTDYSQKVGNIRDRLDRLDGDVTARTTGTFTTEGQRSRTVGAEARPLEDDLGRFSFAKAEASNLVNNQLNFLGQDQQNELRGVQNRMSQFSERAAREITGYTAAKTNELNLLLNKMQRQQSLSDREYARAEQLAAEERDFSRQKSMAKSKQEQMPDYMAMLNGIRGSSGTSDNSATQYTDATSMFPGSTASLPDTYSSADFKSDFRNQGRKALDFAKRNSGTISNTLKGYMVGGVPGAVVSNTSNIISAVRRKLEK